MSDVAWHEMIRMEASVRTRMQGLDAADERVLRLIDLLPLLAGLLLLGQHLGESESDLRNERRETFASSIKKGDELARGGTAPALSSAAYRELEKLTGRSSAPEILLAIVDLRMVAERIAKIQSMGRA